MKTKYFVGNRFAALGESYKAGGVMRRSILTFVVLFASAAPLCAQLSEGYLTDFEGSNSPWQYQYLSESVRWKIDGSPVFFTSPVNTLNQIDGATGVQETGDSEAFSPTAFFGGSGMRYVAFWCRYNAVSLTASTRRSMKIGTNLLTQEPFAVFYFDASDVPNGPSALCTPSDAPLNPNPAPSAGTLINAGSPPPTPKAVEIQIPCPSSTGWHQHTLVVGQPAVGIAHNGTILTGSNAKSVLINNSVVLGVSFHYSQEYILNGCDTAAGLPGWGCMGWMVDDFKLLVNETDPFAPDPEKTGGGGGGGGFKCVGSAPSSAGGPGLVPSSLFLAILAAAASALCRRLA